MLVGRLIIGHQRLEFCSPDIAPSRSRLCCFWLRATKTRSHECERCTHECMRHGHRLRPIVLSLVLVVMVLDAQSFHTVRAGKLVVENCARNEYRGEYIRHQTDDQGYGKPFDRAFSKQEQESARYHCRDMGVH